MKQTHTKAQRVLAIIGVVLLVGLYVAALVSAFFRESLLARRILTAALFCTVAVPVIIWFFQFFIGKTGKPTDELPSDEQ